jgi:hypothetical protein
VFTISLSVTTRSGEMAAMPWSATRATFTPSPPCSSPQSPACWSCAGMGVECEHVWGGRSRAKGQLLPAKGQLLPRATLPTGQLHRGSTAPRVNCQGSL